MNTAPALDPIVLREAAQWLVRLHSGEANAADHAAFEGWCNAHPAHQQAWQRAERLSQKFGAVPPQLGVPVLARQQRSNRRAALRTLAILGTVAPAAWLGWRVAEWMPWAQWSADHHTATGERREIRLADGSRLLLDTASAVNIRFDGAMRTVVLRAGAILVNTAPDPQPQHRPFVVETVQGRLRALGTRFTVRQEQDDARSPVRVAVTEGAVEITPRNATAPALVLPAGQQTVLTAQGAATPQATTAEALTWTQGVLHADNMRLADFCAELSRYRPGVLHCTAEVAELRISGVFQLSDTDYVLSMLASTLPVQVVLRTRYWVTVVPV